MANRKWQIGSGSAKSKSEVANQKCQIRSNQIGNGSAISEVPNWKFLIGSGKSEVEVANRKWKCQTRSAKSEVPSRKCQVRSAKSEVPSRKCQIGSAKSEVPNWKSQISNSFFQKDFEPDPLSP